MKTKRNGMLAILLSILAASCVLTACSHGSSGDNGGSGGGSSGSGSPRLTITGKTFVCASYTRTNAYETPRTYSTVNNGNPYKVKTTTYINWEYFTGDTDTTATLYVWNGIRYVGYSATYFMDGTSITFVFSDGHKTAVRNSETSFTISNDVPPDDYEYCITIPGDKVYRQGSAPSSGSTTISYHL